MRWFFTCIHTEVNRTGVLESWKPDFLQTDAKFTEPVKDGIFFTSHRRKKIWQPFLTTKNGNHSLQEWLPFLVVKEKQWKHIVIGLGQNCRNTLLFCKKRTAASVAGFDVSHSPLGLVATDCVACDGTKRLMVMVKPVTGMCGHCHWVWVHGAVDQWRGEREENSRDDSAVGTKLGLIISVFTVFAHQVMRMRPVRLVLGHQVNANFPFTAIIQNLWSREKTL